MMSLLIKRFIRNNENISAPGVKQSYAFLSSIVSIILNILLCTAKIIIGFVTGSVAISADGFNNLSDAGTSLVSLLGFKAAGYGGGSVHPFGHGRMEWIMGIFTSIAVILMGVKLVDTSIAAITNTKKPLFSVAVVIVLVLSILVKGYMYLYNRKFAKLTDSETLKATATDCISDSAATFAVLLSTVISHLTDYKIDGYCGVLVSVFIIIAGIKSLWEVLERIMGKAADQGVADAVLQKVKEYPEIAVVHNLMLHDYGFGYFVISMQIGGYREDSEQLYASIHEISYDLYKKFHCDCFIQIDYLIEDAALTEGLSQKIDLFLQRFEGGISIDNLRLLENGPYVNITFDMIYPADLQKSKEEICEQIEKELKADNLKYRTTIKGIIRRERFSFHP